MGAVGIPLHQRERDRGAGVASVAGFVPRAARLEQELPPWMAAGDRAAAGRDKHVAVLHEGDVEVLWQRARQCGVAGAEEVIQRQKRARRRLSGQVRSEEHTSELQSLMRISYAVFCLTKKTKITTTNTTILLTLTCK